MADLIQLLEQIRDEKTEDIDEIPEIQEPDVIENMEIPSTISVEGTLKELNELSIRCHHAIKKNPNNQLMLSKLVTISELKCKLLGMFKATPDMQELIDNEVNGYKKRFINIASEVINDGKILNRIILELVKVGL